MFVPVAAGVLVLSVMLLAATRRYRVAKGGQRLIGLGLSPSSRRDHGSSSA